ncbi:piggyBac transposable element-derived protein 4-like [Archocentrus centrarchus]|uniref:piggyBac transposable element-derived protein 4-like n=1 Tax=Archocentrus centrarchus TaxID=63155 RepID=UPI0011E9B74B|nr:piggyBac transposable element-derived protein 4-like [Archocentrus centrarchus]
MEEEEEEESMMASNRGTVTWRSTPFSSDRRHHSSRRQRRVSSSSSNPGPTERARDAMSQNSTASAFLAYFEPQLEDRVIAMTNLEAGRRAGAGRGIDGWRPMGRAEFRAYVGLLILASMYRSRGEACKSLWHAETGRSIFRATMPLKTFRAHSADLRFDDRDTREARRLAAGHDKLAPIREVWDTWCERLPLLYEHGPEVTVDERLVPFKGRCPFKQYMPSKPARYGIKLWVACDAKSSYAWKMLAYTGKCDKRGPPEKNLASRVVLELTEGLGPGRNVTFDNFFTSYELVRRLFFQRGLTSLGTLRANRAEIPRRLLEVKGRPVPSSRFAFSSTAEPPAAAVVSYLAKRNKKVLILTKHEQHVRAPGLSGRADGKPLAVLHYNRTKGGVDNLDKVLGTYSCRRRTTRWPLALFHNMVDVSAYNAFVLWRELNPAWMPGKRNKRRLFLEQLGKELAADAAAAREGTKVRERGDGGDGDGKSDNATGSSRDGRRGGESEASYEARRKRCRMCPRSRDAKTKTLCCGCRVHVCGKCAVVYCPNCASAPCQ